MDPEKLIHMANRIADFFQAEPDRQAALEGIAGHIKRFWDPRMRREILRLVDEDRTQGLSPLVVDALQAHRKAIAPGELRA
jgi:formate dehydrogenase subunit delta